MKFFKKKCRSLKVYNTDFFIFIFLFLEEHEEPIETKKQYRVTEKMKLPKKTERSVSKRKAMRYQ